MSASPEDVPLVPQEDRAWIGWTMKLAALYTDTAALMCGAGS